MDDLDHSVYMAEQDWDSFFQESEECNLQQGALAGLDDSGLSDFDEAEFCLSSQEVQASLESGPLGTHRSIDSPSDLEGLPVKPPESTKDLHGPEDVLAAGESEETVNVFSERTVISGEDEDPAKLSCGEQASADLSKDCSLDKPQEATEPAGACCAACGVDVYQETAWDCVDATGSTSREPAIQMNATAAINLFTELVPQGEIAVHASNCGDVRSALSNLQASNECGHYRGLSAGEFFSVLKGSPEEMNMEIEESEAGQSSLATPSISFSDPQKDSPMNTEAQSDANISARAGHLSDREKPHRKEKERWFVTVNVGQTHSRESPGPPAKKKKRKKSCSEDGPELGIGSEGQDPDIECNSGAERLGVSEPQSQEIDNTPDDSISDAEGSSSNESVTSTRTQHHILKNHNALVLSKEPLPVFQTVCEFEGHKVNCQNSQHVNNHQEQQKVSVGSSLQMNAALERKLALEQNDSTPKSSQPVCPMMSGWTEPSKPITVVTPNPLNHQNLLVKLLFSTQSDTGWEMLVFCKNSDQEDLPFSREETASQDDAEAENQCKNCPTHSQTDSTPKRCSEEGLISSETPISTESPEISNSCVFDTIPGSYSLHRCLSADQQVDLESKKFLSVVPQITDVSEPSAPFVSEINNGSGEFDQSKDFVTPDKVHNSPRIQKDHTCPDQEEVKKSNNKLMCSEETSVPCLYTDERGHTSAKYVIHERDSTLSATANAQPLTVTKVNSCFLTADQQSIEKKPRLEAAILHPVDTTVSDERAVDLSPIESSVMMLRNSISHNPERNENNLTGDDLCLRSANVLQANSAENLSNQTFPEFLRPPLDLVKGEAQELDSEETLAEDSPTASLSAVESPDCNIQSIMEDESVLPKEPGTCTEDLVSRELDPVLDSTRPVYAISSFWDEMEKLTINDILHLRLVSNARRPSDLPRVQDAAVADASDAADSGYFAHPDDSKPDRWAGDTSLLSDFEDEFQQTLSASANPSPEPQDGKSPVLWSTEPCGEWWESDAASTGSGNEAGGCMERPSEDTVSQHLFSDGTQSFKTLCKAATAQNLQTLEEEEQSSMSLPVTGGADESSMLSSLQQRPVETCSLALLEYGNDVMSSPLPLLSGKASPETYVMTFPEISKHFIGEDETETRLSARASPTSAPPSETSLSGRDSPTAYSLCETSLSGRDSPTAYSLCETSLSDRSSPIVVSLSETTLSVRASPTAYSLLETSMSDNASPIVISLPETSLSGRASPTVYSPSDIRLSGRASPTAYSLCETSLSDRSSPIVVSLPETSLSGRASPAAYSLYETSLSGRASPTAYSQCETSLSDRTSSIVYSLCETSLSGRASPIVVSLPETSLSGRASPTVYSLPESSLSGRASPIVVSLPESSLSGRASPFVVSLPESSLSGRASPIVCSLSEIRLSDRDSPIVSLCDRAPSALSLPETYDYFFSDFEAGNIFFPSIRSLSADTGVPIFSCSRSVKREFRFAKEYDYVFPEESPVESEDEDRHSPIHVVTCFDDQPHEPLDALVGPDAYEHFFIDKDWRGSLFGRNLLSLRRLRFTGGLYSSRDRSTSWAFAATGWRERSSLFSTTDPGNPMDGRGRSHSHPNLYLENQLCNEFREQRDTGMQAVVSFPRKGFLFTLRQSDICLVCIAFASWVLKSANPQSADTWKTALLANVSAISAIQYLRRYMREDASENKR
ncbi:uncharacterized protein LOC118210699 isoform X2 [Anguilla anguilla]|uniref:uncharacterized protein LOC118210699 isoform X2 n=1 Tax=Anguilla anguilla TaxID=7936 RepID=UPI0015B0D9A7|nr:uncharacterized protein LOC118210699 isoform X2 [Anguilla anguilla]